MTAMVEGEEAGTLLTDKLRSRSRSRSRLNSELLMASGAVTPHSTYLERMLEANVFLREENRALREELLLQQQDFLSQREEAIQTAAVSAPSELRKPVSARPASSSSSSAKSRSPTACA